MRNRQKPTLRIESDRVILGPAAVPVRALFGLGRQTPDARGADSQDHPGLAPTRKANGVDGELGSSQIGLMPEIMTLPHPKSRPLLFRQGRQLFAVITKRGGEWVVRRRLLNVGHRE